MQPIADFLASLPLDGPGARAAALFVLVLGWGLFVRATLRASAAGRARESLRIKLAETNARAERMEAAEAEYKAERERREALERHQATLSARLEERERAFAELKERYDAEFRSVASQMLEVAHKSFLQRANETFERHAQTQANEAEKRARTMSEIVKPISETLTRYEKGLADMRAQQAAEQGALTAKITDLAKSANDVRAEAHKLSSALRAGSRTRGRWGEEALKNVVELAGLSAYCDFEEQVSINDGEARKRPDMVVRLPGGRFLAIDSKVSLEAYLDAVEETDDARRSALIAKHANQIWEHVKTLASKDYAKAQRDTLDFVVMFLPGDHFLSAAMEARPQLFQEAFERKVLISTPTTLIAILKSVAYGWRQEKMAENAFKIADMARDLYDSLRNMGAMMADVGKSLDQSVKRYNKLVGNVEARVMPRARRFSELELPGAEETIPALEPLDIETRALREGRDLRLGHDARESGGEKA